MQCWSAVVKYPSLRSRCVHTRFFILFLVDKGELLPKTFEKIHNLQMQELDSYKMCTILRNILKEFLGQFRVTDTLVPIFSVTFGHGWIFDRLRVLSACEFRDLYT